MSVLFNPVVVSVLVMVIGSLLGLNVVLAILLAALSAGMMAGLSLPAAVDMLVSGMGNQGNTALSYILLGIFAAMIRHSEITHYLIRHFTTRLRRHHVGLFLALAFVACLSQNAVPVHIAFIPILIPPLLPLFDKIKLDRRAVAVALTFGLQMPYLLIPAGFGLIFQQIIFSEMAANGMIISLSQIPYAMLLPAGGMVVGLLVAIFFSYRRPRTTQHTLAESVGTFELSFENELTIPPKHRYRYTLLAIVIALAVQLYFGSLILGALAGIFMLFLFRIVPFQSGDEMVNEGIRMMAMIAFIMLIASGYATILKETGAVKALIEQVMPLFSAEHRVMAAAMMLFLGLFITLGIGSSFGTVPIIAVLYVPVCAALGFSPLATAALIGTAGALGDAGSPASDSTLGPTAGLNADGKHSHIWGTCVPTFLHFNIPLFIFGLVAVMVL